MNRVIYAGPCEDGTYVSRRTDNQYSFAVAAIDKTERVYNSSRKHHDDTDERGYYPNPRLGQWVALSFHRTAKLADQAARQHRDHGRHVQIVPVIEGTPPTNVDQKENTNMSATATKTRVAKPGKMPKFAKPNAALQGFPACYLGETGNFKPGYDARAKADLKAALTGKPTSPVLFVFTKAQARKLLAKRGW